MDQLLQEAVLFLGLLLGAADDRVESRHHFQRLGRAAIACHAAFEVAVEALCAGKRVLWREDTLGKARSDFAAGFRRARLKQYRVALRRACDVERPAHREMRALMV